MNILVGIATTFAIIVVLRTITTAMTKGKRDSAKTVSDMIEIQHWEDRIMAIFVGIVIVVSTIIFLVTET